ncbi:hypothetical protein Poli38472_013066 [Pythium oligandrum]|uniref:Dienelactone hydrolase domain-containing protein n=1 Tax=Pythium oligandrum TaxID=41045 RepID=A0A8K1CJY2_PYTOL|nr:hypothetical protein Poli38472_013066 [Pythium oligandrum]|eukprot:TMW64444.1 hypothetical protein Poli38472_013066 [Pythium oligandrum]
MSSCCPPGSEPARPTSPHTGETKQFGQTNLYVAGPPPAKVGVLAFPDIFGVNSGRIKQNADRLGEEGYAVVLVDVTKGDYFSEDTAIPTVIAQEGDWLARTDYKKHVRQAIYRRCDLLSQAGSAC